MKNLLSVEGGVELLSCVAYIEEKEVGRLEVEDAKSTIFFGKAIYELGRKYFDGVHNIDGIIIGSGPGSYTALRSLYALCYGLSRASNMPLFQVDSLDAIAYALNQTYQLSNVDEIWACVDARRMEVYAKVYDANGSVLNTGQPVIFSEEYISRLQSENKNLVFIGNSNDKLKLVLNSELIQFIDINFHAAHLFQWFKSPQNKTLYDVKSLPEPIYFKPPNITKPKKSKFLTA